MNRRILLVYANTMMETVLSVNVSLLISCLKRADFEVRLFDTTFYKWSEKSATEVRTEYLQIKDVSDDDPLKLEYKKTDIYEDFRETVKEFDPVIIGFSAVEPTYFLALGLLKSIEDLKKSHDIKVVFGGIHSIMAPDVVVKEPLIDVVCVGEGENSLPEICEKISRGEDYSGIPNMWVKKAGKIIKNQIRPLMDINELPYLDFTLYEDGRFLRPMMGKIYKTMIVEFSRGCPYVCSYCADRALAKKSMSEGASWYREKDVQNAIDEIKYYIKEYQGEYLYIFSESFLAMPQRKFDEFIEKYKEISLPFWFNTRPENITADKMKRLKTVNCHRVSIGIEHGNEEFRRKVLKRHVSNKEIIEASRILKDSGISFSVNNIIGFPDETRELVLDTVELNRQVAADGISVHIFNPYHGTELRDYSVKKGYIKNDLISTDFFIESLMDMPQFSKQQIMGMYRTMLLYIKMPKEYFGEIKKAESFDDQGNDSFKRLKEIYIKNYS
jgi:anaerobic magnesium-protoporphyrin IX monomethyl ester cyclase